MVLDEVLIPLIIQTNNAEQMVFKTFNYSLKTAGRGGVCSNGNLFNECCDIYTATLHIEFGEPICFYFNSSSSSCSSFFFFFQNLINIPLQTLS